MKLSASRKKEWKKEGREGQQEKKHKKARSKYLLITTTKIGSVPGKGYIQQ